MLTMNKKSNARKIELAVFDTAGTFCDGPADLRNRWPADDLKGCKAPVIPFYETLKAYGIECSWETIRKPMGVYKPDHLRILLNDPQIMQQWTAKYGSPWTETDFEEVLAYFRKLLSMYIVDKDLARPIDGASTCFDALKKAGVTLGCDTGYFASDAEALNKVLEENCGLSFDVSSNAEKVPGRPAPFMIYDCMQQAFEQTGKVISCESVVKIDDTAAGILSGKNAGAWTIAVYASGSNGYDELEASEPDYLVPDISYVGDVILTGINERLRSGGHPGQGGMR